MDTLRDAASPFPGPSLNVETGSARAPVDIAALTDQVRVTSSFLDSVFAEVQLVSCRNVLIYFDRELQDRAIRLFRESLCRKGFLGLGSKETLRFLTHAAAFEEFDRQERIYRKR